MHKENDKPTENRSFVVLCLQMKMTMFLYRAFMPDPLLSQIKKTMVFYFASISIAAISTFKKRVRSQVQNLHPRTDINKHTMCRHTYHHYPNCGHIANYTVMGYFLETNETGANYLIVPGLL